MLRSHLHILKTVLLIDMPSSDERVNASLLELASRCVSLEQHIHLSISSALWLRDSEVCPHSTQHASACPEEASLGSPVPRIGVEHVRSEDVGDDTGDVVEITSEDDGLVAETSR
jgi:uncharacterized protein YbbK (DUF523 family)